MNLSQRSIIYLTDLIGGGTVEGVHSCGVREPPGTQTQTHFGMIMTM